MFKAKKRLPRTDFPAALASRRYASAHFSVVAPSNAVGYAVVVSKKVARLSVTRHRIKRRVLGALKKLNLPPALVVFPRSGVDSVSYADMETELAGLLSKISNKK